MRRLLREVAPVGRDARELANRYVDRHNSSAVGRRQPASTAAVVAALRGVLAVAVGHCPTLAAGHRQRGLIGPRRGEWTCYRSPCG